MSSEILIFINTYLALYYQYMLLVLIHWIVPSLHLSEALNVLEKFGLYYQYRIMVPIHWIGLSGISLMRLVYWRISILYGFWSDLAVPGAIFWCAPVLSLHIIPQLKPLILFRLPALCLP